MEEDVAVIGIGCNFPGGEGLDSFWKVLLEGRNCAVDIPAERFDSRLWYDADESKPGKTQTTRAAFIEGFNEFDHRFFGISEAEADCMDPQQKLLLQSTYRALEDAGVAMETISGSRTGVYIGLMNRDYEILQNSSSAPVSHYSATGMAMSVAANRISFTFNLTGPSLAIDSACSSSLVALHLACQAIKQGDCDMALCGGVSCMMEPRVFVALSRAKMISPEGTSKPFSSRADGYGRGEGCGVVLLKPLRKAFKDVNKVWGVISKTAVNQDGRSVTPITRPSIVQQEELLHRIYSDSDLMNVQYVEAHGTGTPAGDPTEAGSISKVIAKARPPGSDTLRIGSVKGNIGHTESAAGVAGLIKVLLMMKNATIVPSVFFSEDTSSVDVKALRIRIPTKAEKWERKGSVGRLAGINSFGFGGTNAHVVVRESEQADVPTQASKHPNIFVMSAASEKSLRLSMAYTQGRLGSDGAADLQALSYTSTCGRSHRRHRYRKAFLTSSLSHLKRQLSSAVRAELDPIRTDLQVVFVFCGNGVAYRGMCRQLWRDVPVFRDKVREVEKLLHGHKSISIDEWLSGGNDRDDFSDPNVVQPLLFTVQVGISCLLRRWGVRPDVVLGHSLGEVAAAHCSGLLSLEDAVRVLHHRSALQSTVTGGKMLLVSNVAVEKVLEVLPTLPGKVCVAALNSPRSCTLSGDADAVDVLHQRLKVAFPEEDLFLHELDVPAAYHSHMMDPILADVESRLGPLEANAMECKLFSTVTGSSCSDGDFTTGRYWARNIREPVLFEEALRAVSRDRKSPGGMVFVEIGPRRALQRNIHETLGNDALVLQSVQPGREGDAIFSTVAQLFELGASVDWRQVYSGCETLPTALPVYQFTTMKKELNFEALRKCDEPSSCCPHPLITQIKPGSREYTCSLSSDVAPYLWEHQHHGVAVVPGSLFVELACAAVMASLRQEKPLSLPQLSVRFDSVLTLSSDSTQLTVTLQNTEDEASFKIQSSAATHSSGTFRCSDRRPVLEEPSVCVDAISQRCRKILKREEIYSLLSQAGFEYGSVFKQLDHVRFGGELREAITAIQVPCELVKQLHQYYIHPVLLDCFLQMTAVVALGGLRGNQGFPSAIGGLTISAPLQENMILYLRATQETADFLEVCGSFCTPDGQVLVELKEVRISFLGRRSDVLQSRFFHNEITAIADETELEGRQIRAVVFEDALGVANGLKPYIHPESVVVERREIWAQDELHNVVVESLNTSVDLENVLFIWGVEDLTRLSREEMFDRLVDCCELFRQIVLALKNTKRSSVVHVVTYRSGEMIVDRISPGFVLSGMVRACAAEMEDISFHLVDLSSVTSEDLRMLVHVINTCKQPEVLISRGQAWTTRVTRSLEQDVTGREGDVPSALEHSFVLQTSDPYRVTGLSASPHHSRVYPIPRKSVEIQLTHVCVHSPDYFPVTTSHLDFGEVIYWSKRTTQNHKLLALDFSGVVTAVGEEVSHLKVGDRVASCYPVVATDRIVIPECVCYSVKSFPFLGGTPCVSYFILAWEILQRVLSRVRPEDRKLLLVSSCPASALVRVLALAANRSGWNVSSMTRLRERLLQPDKSHTLVFLPPFNHSWPLMCEGRLHDRHVVFVCSDHMSSSLSTNMFALNSDQTCVHRVDMANVLQRTYLQKQSRNISTWLMSLGFEARSLPLKKEIFQLSSRSNPEPVTDGDSYFSTKAVQQVVLPGGDSDHLVSDIPLLLSCTQLFRGDSVYIVSGGLSGLGLETVKFIACHGGGCVATLSRSLPSEETRAEMEEIQRRYGVRVLNIQCDVSVWRQVKDAVAEIRQTLPSRPIRGVFHSAAVLHDALVENLDLALLRKVLQPKVSGALNLHHATLHSQLDHFVCFSSISSFIGNPSQSNYAAANSFLDSFCHYRRNLGLAGQAINWGPLNLGLLLNKDHFRRFLEAKGMMVMDVCEVREALHRCLLMNRPQQVICKFNFKNLNVHVLSQNTSLRHRLSGLVELELRDDTSNKTEVKNVSSAHKSVRKAVSDITDLSEDELDDDSALCALGIDSMLAMTLQNRIFQETGINVPLVRILDPNSTLASLVSVVMTSE